MLAISILWWALSVSPFPPQVRMAILLLATLVMLVYVASRFGLLVGL